MIYLGRIDFNLSYETDNSNFNKTKDRYTTGLLPSKKYKFMKKLSFLFLLFSASVSAQSLQSINYNYLYNAETSFSFSLKQVTLPNDSIAIHYQFLLNDTLQKITNYSIVWERFESMSEKTGNTFAPKQKQSSTTTLIQGAFNVAVNSGIVAAKVVNNIQKQSWYYFTVVSNASLTNGYVADVENKLVANYTVPNQLLTLHYPSDQAYAFYYSENFPPATPPFAVVQSEVSPVLKHDSVFTLQKTFIPTKSGVYLIQTDTSKALGFAFRLEDDYPKYKRLENLAEPLTYITTKAEFDRLKNAKSDKKLFDKTILNITGNTERAKLFMRNYFRRVEFANRYFTSYKEGWKTDRGMIYLVFGQPDFVYKFTDREQWEYRTLLNEKITFTFVRSSSVFDADNFVLIRKRSYETIWLEAVDLNRSARF
jgi:GWxTD domain-containing protein